MSHRLVAAAILFAIAFLGVGSANIVWYVMVERINRKRPPDGKMSYSWWTFPKTRLLFYEYRTQYPDERLHVYALALGGAGLVCFLIFGSLIGLPL